MSHAHGYTLSDAYLEIALISGHKDVRQLFRYTHLKPESLIAKYSQIF